MEAEKKLETENGGGPGKANILKPVYAILRRLAVVVGVIGVIWLPFGAYDYLIRQLDERIESKFNDAEFLRKLARSVRPSLVFDEKGSIIADMGAGPYMAKISVSKGAKDTFEIVVSPIEYLGVEPVLEALDGDYKIHAERGQKFDWIFRLNGIETRVTQSSPIRDKQRFRLELIR